MFLPGFFSKSNDSGWFSSSGSSVSKQSKAGITVDHNSALAHSTVYACVTFLAESVAQLPCTLYRRTGEDTREKATDHPLYNLLRYQPNKKDSAYEYFETTQGHEELRGNSFSLIERENGAITELIPVNPDKMTILASSDGLPYYKLEGNEQLLSQRHVHHVKGFSLNGFRGISPIEACADTIGLSLATEEHASSVFSNGTTLSGVIERPGGNGVQSIKNQAAIDKLLTDFSAKHSGLRNLMKVAFLQEGMTFKQLGMTNGDAQLIESRRFGVEEICRIFKLPRHFVQDSNSMNFNTTEQMGLVYVIYTLMSRIKRRESAMMRDLLLPEERSEYYIEFNFNQLLRGDQASRYASYAIGRQWGWLSVNDIRRLENLPPVKVGGDIYLQPLNMVDISNPQAMQPTPQQLDEIGAMINAK